MADKPLDETHPHLNEFFEYIELLRSESDRGMVLISTGFLEEQLKQIVAAFLVDDKKHVRLLEGGNSPLSTLSARIAMAHALALISDEERADLDQLRKIRNEFAHNMRASFDDQQIADRCGALHSSADDFESEEMGKVTMSPRDQFMTAATSLILNFVNRPHYVSKSRRTYQAWPY